MPDYRDIDEHDRALLGLLQKDALRTADDLARDVPLSPSAIARRVRRMREDGTIGADVSIVSDRVVPSLFAVIEVQLDVHARTPVEALLARLGASAHVQALMEVTGPFDLLLVTAFADIAAFNAFTDALLAADPVVRRYETRIVKHRRKFSTALPIA